MNLLYFKSFLLAGALFFFCFEAVAAGWMDEVGGLLNSVAPSSSTTATLPAVNGLSSADMITGLKDALRVGSARVVGQLGRVDGFNGDPKIHIPLPDRLQTVRSALSAVGMASMMDDLELRLNRAAEAATPQAKRLFVNAIQNMKFTDAKKILRGEDDAATLYFERKVSAPLSDKMRPIVTKALSQSGALQAYDSVMGKYHSLPFMPDVKADLTQHVVRLGLSAIFRYMAEEEAAIRKDPMKRTTSMLKKVFAR